MPANLLDMYMTAGVHPEQGPGRCYFKWFSNPTAFKGMADPHQGVLCLGGCDAQAFEALLLQDM